MKYEVTIRATVYKTITVDADNQDEAYESAHDLFSMQSDGWPEKYEQETMDIRTVKSKPKITVRARGKTFDNLADAMLHATGDQKFADSFRKK
jgi:hypothetical protein